MRISARMLLICSKSRTLPQPDQTVSSLVSVEWIFSTNDHFYHKPMKKCLKNKTRVLNQLPWLQGIHVFIFSICACLSLWWQLLQCSFWVSMIQERLSPTVSHPALFWTWMAHTLTQDSLAFCSILKRHFSASEACPSINGANEEEAKTRGAEGGGDIFVMLFVPQFFHISY